MGHATANESSPSSSSSCPVDPRARAAWLENAKDESNRPPPHPLLPSSPAKTPTARITKTRPLASDRETSSIPRALSSSSTSPSAPTTHQFQHPPPAPISAAASSAGNAAGETAGPQHWVYPSERQFYEALRRKNHSPSPTTIASIVPIHNAVNERAWSSILSDWELRSPGARRANAACGGPRLRSFSGDSSKLTPRARIYGWLGYERPFDRHDWVVERCDGEAVEYVIDFYRGRGGGLSFFLDVRPKLNSWAGWKLRLGKLVGL